MIFSALIGPERRLSPGYFCQMPILFIWQDLFRLSSTIVSFPPLDTLLARKSSLRFFLRTPSPVVGSRPTQPYEPRRLPRSEAIWAWRTTSFGVRLSRMSDQSRKTYL